VWQTDNSRIAAAVLAEQAAGNPSSKLTLVGVTGTNGKTTVTHLLAGIAKAAGRKAAVVGTLGVGEPGDLKYFGYTTPEAENLSPMLADLVNEGFDYVAMEVSSHSLALYRVDGLKFVAAGFTNLSQDHLDFHGTMENYRAAKMRLFDELLPKDGVAVSSLREAEGDVPIHPRLLRCARNDEVNAKFSADGIEFDLTIDGQTAHIKSPLVGKFNLENMLCAALLAHGTGIPLEAIVEGLENPTMPKGRLERVGKFELSVFVDFAHTPDALENVLETLREICTGRLIVVFGCGGDRDRAKRPLMTAAVKKYADVIIATQDNPRHEDPKQIFADMCLTSDVLVVSNRRDAIGTAIKQAGAGDVVLIAGKGHETTQQIGDNFEPFDDAEIAREYLLNRYPNT
jgi:UDP-N-acetylmuramoyl-L-alanyl-D-glutamate--2,6-diaminopimelate ligase